MESEKAIITGVGQNSEIPLAVVVGSWSLAFAREEDVNVRVIVRMHDIPILDKRASFCEV